MAKTKIILNSKEYLIDESVLSSASSYLKEHLSTVMNGSGAVINLDGVPYNIDTTKLTTATNNFISHLGTITGNGSKVTIGGVEYGIDSSKVASAVSALDAAFGELENGGEERLEGDGAEYYTLAPTALTFRSTAPLNELQSVQINGVTVDPANYTLEEGSTIVTFPIDYLKTLNVGNYEVTVASDSKTVKGGFTVAAPELNEHGFYYNQPYTAFVAPLGVNLAVFLRKGGIADIINIDYQQNNEKGTYVVDENGLSVTCSLGTLNCAASNNGTEIFCAQLGTAFVLNSNNIVSDYDYLYIYDNSLGGYLVNCIDKTQSSYGAIKTGINGVDTVALTEFMFENNTDITNIPKIPESISVIAKGAFQGCENLTNVLIPASIKIIAENAFHSCTSLTDIVIPNSVTSIGARAFAFCSSLASVTIPEGVTSIGYGAFNGCTSLKSVVIPDSVTDICGYAFSDCINLTSVVIPNSVTSIDEGVFMGCAKLANIIIPDSVTKIGSNAFYDCTSLASVTIPDSVTSIGSVAFSGCTGLANITFEGTTAQWNAITFGSDWNYEVPATYVQCSDGQVAL